MLIYNTIERLILYHIFDFRIEVILVQNLELKGTYFEIGKAFGKCRRGLDKKLEFAYKCEDVLKEYACDLHDELRGFSEGIGLNHESVLVSQLLHHEISGCNLFFLRGERTENGHPIFVRHMDWFEGALQLLVLLKTRPLGKYGALGLSFAEIGCYDGINTAGLAVGAASVPFFTGKQGVGLLNRYVIRWALDNFSSVEETVDYLKRVPHAVATNFLIADKTGASARVEASPTRVRAEVSNEDINVVNNFFILQGTRDLDNMPKNDRSWMYNKRLHTWFLAAGNKIELRQVKEVCRSHEMGICEHLQDPPGGTIYSWIADLGTNTIHLSVGFPCLNHYVSYSIA
jgi:predicted choloylglycine hydrolase